VKDTRAKPIKCDFCSSTHMPRFLCDQAQGMLQAMAAKARARDIPITEFAQPVDTAIDTILSQFTVMAGTIPIGDSTFPALVFTGQDAHGKDLPKWTYAGSPEQVLHAAQLVTSRALRAVEACGIPADPEAEPEADQADDGP
jgi:hypothetical protein